MLIRNKNDVSKLLLNCHLSGRESSPWSVRIAVWRDAHYLASREQQKHLEIEWQMLVCSTSPEMSDVFKWSDLNFSRCISYVDFVSSLLDAFEAGDNSCCCTPMQNEDIWGSHSYTLHFSHPFALHPSAGWQETVTIWSLYSCHLALLLMRVPSCRVYAKWKISAINYARRCCWEKQLTGSVL